jgi:hypothetical protein
VLAWEQIQSPKVLSKGQGRLIQPTTLNYIHAVLTHSSLDLPQTEPLPVSTPNAVPVDSSSACEVLVPVGKPSHLPTGAKHGKVPRHHQLQHGRLTLARVTSVLPRD